MIKFNSLAACSSASDATKSRVLDVIDLFGVDANSGDILQLHLEQDVWRRVRMSNPYADEKTRFSGRMFDSARAIALASFPPGLSEIETKRRLCERLYGNEVNVDAYIEHLTRRNNSLKRY